MSMRVVGVKLCAWFEQSIVMYRERVYCWDYSELNKEISKVIVLSVVKMDARRKCKYLYFYKR